MQIAELVHRETFYKEGCCILSPLTVTDRATHPTYKAVSPWTVLYRHHLTALLLLGWN